MRREATMFVVVCKPIDEEEEEHMVFSNRVDAKAYAGRQVMVDERFNRADIYEVTETFYPLRAVALVKMGQGKLVDASVKPATPWDVSDYERLEALNRLAAVLERFLNECFDEARAKFTKLDLPAELTRAEDAAGARTVRHPEKWFIANFAPFEL